MNQMEREAAKRLEAQIAVEISRANRDRWEPLPYRVGDWVWVLRPKSSLSAAKVDTWWLGPSQVLRKTGKFSYEVELRPGLRHATHVDRMKPFVQGQAVDLFHFTSGEIPEELAPREWNVEEILDHRWTQGRPEFLTRWEGAEPEETTWEPVGNFVHRYSYKLPEYCQKKGIRLNLAEHLSAKPLAV